MRSASVPGGRALALLGAFASVSAVMGLLLAGIALPAAWATGSATRGGVDFFNSLPDDVAEPPLSEQSTVLDADGRQIAHFYDERRILVSLAQIAPIMQQSIIAIEDSRFLEHGGVDPKGLARAFVNNQVNDGNVQGASTLTQQYIKLRIFEAAAVNQDKQAQQDALRKDYTRKLQEVRMAISLEKKKTKSEILEGYLNIANFGDSTYGVEAAAEYFFDGTSAAKLTLPQAALLAGLVQSPQRYSPFIHQKAALNRRNDVLARLHQLGKITDAEYAAAVKSGLGVKKRTPREGCITSAYAYFCSYVRNQLVKSDAYKALGATEDERRNLLDRGGLTIRTTIKQNVQETAQAAVNAKVPPGDASQVGAAAVTVEPGTGKVLAMVQNRTYDVADKPGDTVINYSVDQSLGSGNGFQTGSTFKPFVLADWLAHGKGLYDVVDASKRMWNYGDFEGCKGTLRGESFPMSNSGDSENKPAMTVLEATSQSVNLAYMDMASKLSLCDISATATKLGVHKGHPYAAGNEGVTSALPTEVPSMVLGAVDVAPLTMAEAYATFAKDGLYCAPLAVTAISDRDGKALKVPSSQCSQAMDPNIAHGVTYALKTVLRPGGTASQYPLDRVAAGKTGTTNDSKDTWFVGYIPQLSTAVWVGDNPNPSGKAGRRSLNNRKIGSTHYGSVFGATISAPIWQEIMNKISKGMPEKDWDDPTGKVMSGSQVKMNDYRGQPVDQAKATLEGLGYKVTVGAPVPSDLGPDKVENTTPSAGSISAPGGAVVIHPGNGQGQPSPSPGDPNQPGGPGGPGASGSPGPGQPGATKPGRPSRTVRPPSPTGQ